MFLMTKILGFDVLLTNLMIVKISGSYLGHHLELQLFGPYLKDESIIHEEIFLQNFIICVENDP